MKDKKASLKQRVQETVRKPEPERLKDDKARGRQVRVMAYSLLPSQIAWVENLAASLQKAGNTRANRSLVVSEALLRLEEELHGKSAAEILDDFHARQKKRAQADGG